MASGYTSRELFHFFGREDPAGHDSNYEILCKVIRGGCISHPPHDGSWGETRIEIDGRGTLAGEDLIVPSITCYCDIPADRLDIHCSKYGYFGVSFSRDYLAKYGARPVMYVPYIPGDIGNPFGVTLLKDIEAVFKGLEKSHSESGQQAQSRYVGRQPQGTDEILSALRSVFMKDLLGFIKPFDSTLSDADEHSYYMEREWRKHGNLQFKPDDVSSVIVHTSFESKAKSELPEFVSKIRAVG